MAFICDGQFEVPQQEMAAAERKIKLEMVKEIKVETEKNKDQYRYEQNEDLAEILYTFIQ